MRKLTTSQRAAILSALVEGNSISAVHRMFGYSKITILRLLADAGTLAAQFHDLTVRELGCRRVQVDEIWGFCGCKDKAKLEGAGGFGSHWTWIAIDADTKLVVSYLVGLRDAGYAHEFMHDVADRIESRIQLTSDGHNVYLDAVDSAFAGDVDYARLVKIYGANPSEPETRYSPAQCIDCKKEAISGNPDEKHISTSYVERQNLTMRMSMRRMTRLTNGFSKKIENHEHATAIHYMHYNFMRKHQTLKTTPAVMAGIADHVWTMAEFVELLEREEAKSGGRLTDYKPAASKRSA